MIWHKSSQNKVYEVNHKQSMISHTITLQILCMAKHLWLSIILTVDSSEKTIISVTHK